MSNGLFNPFYYQTSGGDGTRGIASVSFYSSDKGDIPGIQGATDTYKILYTDGTSDSFVVHNGADANFDCSVDNNTLIFIKD